MEPCLYFAMFMFPVHSASQDPRATILAKLTVTLTVKKNNNNNNNNNKTFLTTKPC